MCLQPCERVTGKERNEIRSLFPAFLLLIEENVLSLRVRKAIPKQINDMTKQKTILLVLLLALLLPLHAAKRKTLTGICHVVDGHTAS